VRQLRRPEDGWNMEDLAETCSTLDTCYKRPDKYMAKALKPIVEFRRYRIVYIGVIREFYSLLRYTIRSTRRVGHLKLLINYQTVPSIIRKMTHTDWKQWTISQPDWIREVIEELLEKFVEQKWNDALNLATAEPVNRDAAGAKPEKSLTRSRQECRGCCRSCRD
jgi:hypothetical protein